VGGEGTNDHVGKGDHAIRAGGLRPSPDEHAVDLGTALVDANRSGGDIHAVTLDGNELGPPQGAVGGQQDERAPLLGQLVDEARGLSCGLGSSTVSR